MMRCMTAICPAGPPKDNAATRSQTRSASPNETPCAGSRRVVPLAVRSVTRFSSGSRRRRVPIVLLVLTAAAPGVERIVHHEAVLQHLMVVCEIRRKTERQGQKARRLRRQFRPRRIGAAHDDGKRLERLVLDAVDLQKGIKAAQLALMRERLGARDVVSDRARHPRDIKHLLGRDIEKRRFRIDKAADQPWAGDTVDLRTLARDPAAVAERIFLAKRQAVLGPPGDAAFEIARFYDDASKASRHVE